MSRDQTFSINSRNPFSSRIGRRIIFFLVVLSGAVTLMTTLTQTYFDYDREFNEVSPNAIVKSNPSMPSYLQVHYGIMTYGFSNNV